MHINGAKGLAMISFGIMAGLFGVAYLSPWKIIPPPPRGLMFLNDLVPLEIWGGLWWVAAIALFIGAFREDQSQAMAPFSAMLFVWAASYAFSAWDQFQHEGYTTIWLGSALFLALLVASLAVARLVNSPPVNLEEVQQRALSNGDPP